MIRLSLAISQLLWFDVKHWTQTTRVIFFVCTAKNCDMIFFTILSCCWYNLQEEFFIFYVLVQSLEPKIFAFSPKIFRSITRNRWYNMVVLYVFLALCFICTIPSLLHYIFIYLFLFFLKKNFIGLLQWQNDLLLLGKLPNSAFSGNPSLSKTKIVLSV